MRAAPPPVLDLKKLSSSYGDAEEEAGDGAKKGEKKRVVKKSSLNAPIEEEPLRQRRSVAEMHADEYF